MGVNSLLKFISPAPVDSQNAVASSAKGGGEADEQDVGADELSTIGDEVGSSSSSTVDTAFSFECAVSEKSNVWAVERLTILASQIERCHGAISALMFDVEVAVRGNGVRKEGSVEMLEEGELEVRAVLNQRDKYGEPLSSGATPAHALMKLSGDSALAAGLLGLELGGGALSPDTATLRALKLECAASSTTYLATKNPIEMHYGTKIIRTPPQQIQVTLIPPLKLTVREVCGARAASGSTLVEITVEHSSEWHRENVTVTGIAFHPGQSRLWEEQDDPSTNLSNQSCQGKSIQGGELSVIDMSRRVRWGFCPGTAPDLPLLLGLYEAFATVIQIDAGEDVRSRAFLSPVSVNAMVGSNDMISQHAEPKDKTTDTDDGERIMVSTDVRWTTSRVAVENSDAFKVDMSLRGGLNTVCRVGAPLIISLRVLNLSMEPRDLMLLMAKDGEGRKNELQWERPVEGRRGRTKQRGMEHTGTMRRNLTNELHQQGDVSSPKENQLFSTAVVSEVNGYTFGVWGLSGDDDGTTRHHRDHELLAVDAALLLGEVKGQHSIEAELRFVPLREGTLDVPNLKLYDKRGGRWYNCVHTLKIVAAAKA